VSVDKLWLPDIEDESGARDRITETAQRFGTAVEFIRSTSNMVFGEADMTVYPPLMSGDMNEQGLTALCSAGDFDILITGDMAGTTEKRLVETYRMPDVEVLLVSHHGSRYSSDSSFLSSVCPDTAIISVGYNTYGHPTQEAISRLKNCGAEIYRTDEQGSILITVIGGEE
jgi:competence protein ComEC